jgi:flagellar hook-associated protein 1 FlgK
MIQVIDQYLEERLRNATSEAMSTATQQNFFTQLEHMLNATTSSDLSASILSFFNSIDNILNHPEDESYRRMAVEQGIKLVGDINSLAKSIVNLQLDVNKQLAREIVKMTRLLLKQNYFQFRQKIYTLDYFRYIDDKLILYTIETEQDSQITIKQ